MKTTDMFLSADERRRGDENVPIILSISKTPQGQVLSPHVVSLRASAGARKLPQSSISKKLSHAETFYTPKEQVKPAEGEDEILSSISALFRGKNARVHFTDEKQDQNSENISTIPSQTEQIEKMKQINSMKHSETGFLKSWFGRE